MKFPLTQDLVLEVLVARARRGEPFWHFPRTARKALDALTALGLVQYQNEVIELRAYLTQKGRDELMYATYEAPTNRQRHEDWKAGRQSAIDDLTNRTITRSPWKKK